VAGGRWQVAGGRRQVAGCRRQVAGGRRQVAGGRWQAAGGRRQVAGGRRQAAGGRRQGSGGTLDLEGRTQRTKSGKLSRPDRERNNLRPAACLLPPASCLLSPSPVPYLCIANSALAGSASFKVEPSAAMVRVPRAAPLEERTGAVQMAATSSCPCLF
jgi:hypothetical protein